METLTPASTNDASKIFCGLGTAIWNIGNYFSGFPVAGLATGATEPLAKRH